MTSTFSSGFVLPTTTSRVISIIPTSTMVRYTASSPDSTSLNGDSIDTDIDTDTDSDRNAAMRKDIDQMKQEAIARLDALKDSFHQAQDTQTQATTKTTTTTITSSDSLPLASTTNGDRMIPTTPQEDLVELKAMETTVSQQQQQQTDDGVETRGKEEKTVAPQTDIISLLDSTHWRLMLNVGREQGTWMPKTWGISGERLLMNLEIEFSPELLYEREDFLNGVSGTKVLNVVHNELTLTPTIKEGSRRIRVKNGGWRVALGEGPLGTDVLRFYMELQEQARHEGSDVYCPAARIYCTCGYFPMVNRNQHHHHNNNNGSLKDTLRQEQEVLTRTYETLVQENDLDPSLLSLKKMQRTKEMMQLRMQATKLNQRIIQARTKEPEKALLRLDQKQQVGLTRVGGICCKVQKGLAVEYHILGKFELASNREQQQHPSSESSSSSSRRELLP